MLYENMPEMKAQSGVGAMLFAKNENNKYSLFIPLESVPAVVSTPESIDIDVTSSNTITKIAGKVTMEDKETEFFLHRDSIRKLKQVEGKKIEFLVVNPDFTGYRFNATVSFTQKDATSKDPLKGTMKITPNYDGGFIDNVYDLIQKTVKFTTGIDPVVVLEETGDKFELTIETDPKDATITATSESTGVATAAVTGGKLTVTSVDKGSTVVVLKAEKEGFASWETTLLVIVE